MNGLGVPDTLPTGSATGNPRNKVALKRGRGILDWVRLGHTHSDLAGTGGKLLKVTPAELAKHNTKKDAWMALKGKVYNVTPYFEYHPGGEDELLRGAGIDATDLFNEVHKWVNFTSMLQKCLVGTLVEDTPFFFKPNFLPFRKTSKSPESDNSLMPPPGGFSFGFKKTLSPVQKQEPPKYDWFQTKEMVAIAVYTKWKHLNSSHIVIISKEKDLKIVVFIEDKVLTLHWELLEAVEPETQLKVQDGNSGKIEVSMRKVEQGTRWSTIGTPMNDHHQYVSRRNFDIHYIECKLSEKVKINHDSYLYVLELPNHIRMRVPIGWHVYLQAHESESGKPYTPVITPFLVSKDVELTNPQTIQIFFKVYSDGEVTPKLEELCEGDSLNVSLPDGSFSIQELQKATVEASHLVLLGAGTGITPLIKLMLRALSNDVNVLLVTFNKTEEDIPWRIELDSLVVTRSKLRVTHVLSQPSGSWKGLTGRVKARMLQDLLPVTDGEKPNYVGVCGSSGFNKNVYKLLNELGHVKEEMFIFEG